MVILWTGYNSSKGNFILQIFVVSGGYHWVINLKALNLIVVVAENRDHMWLDLQKPDIIVHFSNSILLHFYNLHTQVYVLAKF